MAFSGRAPEGYDLTNSGVDHTSGDGLPIQNNVANHQEASTPQTVQENQVEISFDENLKTPLGLPANAPTKIRKSNGTFIEALPRKQFGKFKYVANHGVIVVLMSAALVFLIIGIGKYLDSIGANNLMISAIFILLMISILFGSMIYSFFAAIIARKLMLRKVSKRPNTVIDLEHSSTKYFHVEETATYAKMKALPDDAIVMSINQEGLGIEGSKFRCWIKKADVDLKYETINTLAKERSLCVSCQLGEYHWSVVLKPVINMYSSTFSNKDKVSKQLWQEIYDALNGR